MSLAVHSPLQGGVNSFVGGSPAIGSEEGEMCSEWGCGTSEHQHWLASRGAGRDLGWR